MKDGESPPHQPPDPIEFERSLETSVGIGYGADR